MSDSVPYQHNYMNRIIINPLAKLMELISMGQVWECICLERFLIPALPDEVYEELKEVHQELSDFIDKYLSIKADLPHSIETQKVRQQFLIAEGDPLAQRVYDNLWRLLYKKRVFAMDRIYGVDIDKLSLDDAE